MLTTLVRAIQAAGIEKLALVGRDAAKSSELLRDPASGRPVSDHYVSATFA